MFPSWQTENKSSSYLPKIIQKKLTKGLLSMCPRNAAISIICKGFRVVPKPMAQKMMR